MLLRSNFSSFPQYFQYISNLGVKLRIHSVEGGCSINCFFLSSVNLICRTTDISKCFIETLGVRDNESRLYFLTLPPRNHKFYFPQKLLKWLQICNILSCLLQEIPKKDSLFRLILYSVTPCSSSLTEIIIMRLIMKTALLTQYSFDYMYFVSLAYIVFVEK